jgi:hypothetical protein
MVLDASEIISTVFRSIRLEWDVLVQHQKVPDNCAYPSLECMVLKSYWL